MELTCQNFFSFLTPRPSSLLPPRRLLPPPRNTPAPSLGGIELGGIELGGLKLRLAELSAHEMYYLADGADSVWGQGGLEAPYHMHPMEPSKTPNIF